MNVGLLALLLLSRLPIPDSETDSDYYDLTIFDVLKKRITVAGQLPAFTEFP